MSTAGVATMLAGDVSAGYIDGLALVARFSIPTGIAIDTNNLLYIADSGNHMIRKVTTSG